MVVFSPFTVRLKDKFSSSPRWLQSLYNFQNDSD
jgi:hypothetical protein